MAPSSSPSSSGRRQQQQQGHDDDDEGDAPQRPQPPQPPHSSSWRLLRSSDRSINAGGNLSQSSLSIRSQPLSSSSSAQQQQQQQQQEHQLSYRLNPAVRKKMGWRLTKPDESQGSIEYGPAFERTASAHLEPKRIVKPLKQNPYSLFGGAPFKSSSARSLEATSAGGMSSVDLQASGSLSLPTTGQHSSTTSTLLSFRVDLLRDREKAKRPTRDIAMWIPVTLYILNDVLNGTFTLIPFIMGLNGWIGGLGIIWLMGLVGYYTSNLLYRMSIVFPGAVSMGDLSYYLNRSVFGMTVTFILAYLLMFLTSSQQLSMAASMFQYVAAGGKYIIYLPAWLVIMVLVLIPLSQVRTLRSVFWINLFNVTAVLIFWGIAMGVNLYKIIVIGNEAGIPTKLFPPVEDVQFWNNTRYDNIQIGFPLGGVMIAFQMFYYQLS